MKIVRTPHTLSAQWHFIGMDLHTHEAIIEAELLVDGSGNQTLNGHPYAIQKGSFWISRPQDFHTVEVPKGSRILNVQFIPGFLSSELLSLLLNYPDDICLSLSDSDFSDFCTLMETVLAEYEHQADFSFEIIKRQLELMLLKAFRLLPLSPQERRKIQQNPLMEKAILFLRSNFSESPSLARAAEFVHLNADYFAAQFKQYTKKTYYTYLTELKLAHARKLVLETELTLAIVAFKCGFGDQSNFLRQFKKHFGCTPTEMRAKKTQV